MKWLKIRGLCIRVYGRVYGIGGLCSGKSDWKGFCLLGWVVDFVVIKSYWGFLRRVGVGWDRVSLGWFYSGFFFIDMIFICFVLGN